MKIRCLLAIALCASLLRPVSGEEIRDYYAEPGLNPFKETLDQAFNESVDPFSGTLQLKYTDIHVPGNGGMDLTITRTYTSLQTNAYPSLNRNGLGWTMHFGRIVVSRNHLNKICTQGAFPLTTKENPSLELPDGGREILALSSLHTDGTLITRSNWIARCNGGQGMVVTAPNGTRYTMDQFDNFEEEPSYLTTRIEDVHGNWIAIAYGTNSLGVAYIDQISRSEDGVVATFEYEDINSPGIAVSAINAGGQRMSYRYETIPGYMFPYYKQLVQATRADGTSWRYTYNPKMSDPDPSDDVLEDGMASYSLIRVGYPHGAAIDYSYQYVRFDPGSHLRTTAIHRKIVTGPQVTGGTWTYEFAPHSQPYNDNFGGQLRYDVTTITAPEAVYRYAHLGKDFRPGTIGQTIFVRPSFVGLLIEKTTHRRSGGLIEREVNSWGERKISEEDFWHGGEYRSWWRDDGTYAAVLIGNYVNRDSQSAGSFTHAKLYSDFDAYGNPGTIAESSNIEGQPGYMRRVTYVNDTTKWIIGLPEDEVHEQVSAGVDTTVGTIDRDYDGNGKIRRIVEFGEETRFTYHGTGDLESTRDARGNLTQFLDYKRGIARTERRPESIIISRTVNDSGTLRSETNGRGFTTHYRYDDLNRLIAIDYPGKADVSIDYNGAGGGYQRILTRGDYRQTETINDFGHVVRVERHDLATGQSIVRTSLFDAFGRETFTSYPNSTIGTTRLYDALGRLERLTHPDNTFVRYQYDDSTVVVTNERGFTTTYLYFVRGTDFSDMMPISISEPENVGTHIKRNVFGDIVQVFQGERLADNSLRGHAKTFRYDSARRLVETTEREVGTTVFGHDAVGNVTSERVNNLPPTTFAYDDLNRRTRVDFADATPDVVTTYDANGNVERLTKGATEWVYTYDENDNLSSERLTIDHMLLGPRVYLVTHQYSDLDVLSSITYPSGLVVDYQPDAFGRATRAGSYATSVTYHPSGSLAGYQLANGVSTSIALNQRLMPQSITAAGIVNLTYGYDAGGNVRSIGNAIEPSRNVSMPNNGYDGLDRLRVAQGSWGTARFTYDFHGNLLTQEVGSRTRKHVHDSSNRLRHVERFPTGSPSSPENYLRYDFDGRGNAIARRDIAANGGQPLVDEKLFVYDAASQLVRARANRLTLEGNAPVTFKDYAYDGNGQRVVEHKHGSYDIRFSVYSRGQLLFEDVVAECTRTDHVRLGALAIARSDDQSAVPSLDTDGDAIPDCLETLLGLDPNNAADAAGDRDNDGITNLAEYRAGTSLTRADTDGDGLSDRDELERDLTDATLADTDGDGLGDGVEAGNPRLDPRLADKDHDGVSDAWELALQTDPEDPADGLLDSDSDGYSNRQESGAKADPQSASVLPARGSELWTANTLGAVDGAPVISRDRTVIVSTNTGRVLAFHPDGTQRWQFAPLSSQVSEPAIGPDGTIYVVSMFQGGIQPGGSRSYVHALNPDGTQRWVWGTPFYLTSGITIGEGGRLYFSGYRYDSWGYTNFLLSLSAAGTSPSQRVSEYNALVPLTIGASGDVIMVASNRVMAFSKTLEPQWTYEVRSTIDAPPTFGKDGSIYAVDRSGYVYALNPSGELRWEVNTGSGIQSAVTIAPDGTLYVGLQQSKLLSLNPDGTQRWSMSTSGTTFTPAIAADGTIYGTTFAGDLFAAAADGSVLWKVSTGARLYGAPIVDRDGTVYFTTYVGQLHAVADNAGGPALTGWPMYRHDSASSNYLCFNERAFSILADSDGDHIDDCAELRYGLDPTNPDDGAADADGDGLRNFEEHQRGTRLDVADTDADGLHDGLEVLTYRTNPLAADSDHDTILDGAEVTMNTNPLDGADASADSDNDGFSNRQESLANTDPRNATSQPTEGQLVRDMAGVAMQVAVGRDGTIYQYNTSGSPRLEALYPDFTIKWSVPMTVHAGPVVGADGTVYVIEARNGSAQRLMALWPTGLLRWTVTRPATSNSGFGKNMAVGSDGRLFVSHGTGHWQGDDLLAFDATGAPAANWPQYGVTYFGRDGWVSIGPTGNVSVYDGLNSLTLFDGSGAYRWDNRDSAIGRGSYGVTMFGADGTLYLSNGWGLHALDPANGTRRWHKPGANGMPLIDASGNLILYCAQGQTSLCAVDPQGNTLWTESTGLGFLGTPAIDASGAIITYSGGNAIAFNPGGSVRWQVAGPPAGYLGTHYPVLLDDGVIYLPANPRSMVILGQAGLADSAWPARHRDNQGSRNAAGVSPQIPSPEPSVVVTDPASGDLNIEIGENRTVRALATDLVDGDLSAAVRWISSLDGHFATGATASLVSLSPGTHTVTAAVTDSEGLSDSAAFTVHKAVIAPVLNINSPYESRSFDVGENIYFSGYATDQLDGYISNRIRWTSDRDGELFVGSGMNLNNLSAGVHVITATVTDSSGASDSKSITVTVEYLGPTIEIYSPRHMGEVELGLPTTFEGYAYDAVDGDMASTMRWISDRDGLLGTGAQFTITALSAGAHVITVTAQDSLGTVTTRVISVLVRALPPQLSVQYPQAGLQAPFGTELVFYGVAWDSKDGDLGPALQWSSNLDGHLGTGNDFFTRDDLSVGSHRITASVTDSDGQTAISERYIHITSSDNYAPWVSVFEPYDGSEHYVTDPVTFRADAYDNEEGPLTSIAWRSSIDGAIGSGPTFTTSSLSVGTHRIDAFVTDSANGKAAGTITISILPTPANFRPQVSLAPIPVGANYVAGSSFTLTGTATDREDGDISNRLQWSSDIDGPLGSGSTVMIPGLSAGWHTITATVTDNYGESSSSTMTLDVFESGTATFAAENFSNGYIEESDWRVVDDGIATPSSWSVMNGRAMETSDAQAGDAAAAALPKPGTYLLHRHGSMWLDYRLEATLRSSDDDALGLMFRFVDNDNYYRFSMDRERSYRRLVRKVNGVFTTLWQDSTRYSLNTNVNVVIGAVGSSLTLSINGTQVYSGTDTSHRRGSVALYSWGETGAMFDNVRVVNLRTAASNDAPLVSIANPANGSTHLTGTIIALSGSAQDFEDGAVSHLLEWSSNRDGALGTGSALNVSSLSPGTHTLTASAMDSRGATGSATVSITVNEPFNDPPVIALSAPAEGASYNVGAAVPLAATATDVQDGTISNGITWTSSRNGVLGTGANLSVATLSAGAHVITASITDSGGKSATVTRNIAVAVPGNNQPNVTLSAPLNGAAFQVGETVTLTGTAADAEDGNVTASIAWSSSINGPLGTGGSRSVNTLTGGVHTITATVADSMGGTRSATATITVVPVAAVLLRDDFNDNNFSGWTVTDQGTVSAPSAWSASTGALRQTSDIHSTPTTASTVPKTGTFNRFVAGSAWTNYSVTTELRSSDNDTLGVMFRYTNTSNYYRFSMDAERAQRRLTRVRGGTWTTLWSDSTVYQQNRTYVLEIIANGSTLTVKLDGVQLWSGTNSQALTSGTVALYSWQNTGAQFDNVLVRNLSVPLTDINEPKRGFDRSRGDALMFADRIREPTPTPPGAPPERLALVASLHSEHRSNGEGAVR